MEKFIKYPLLLLVLSGLLLSSCTKDFEEINSDPNNISNALPQQLLAPALVGTLTYNMLRSRNFNNELMHVTVEMSEAEGRVFRYDVRPNYSDYLYNGLYSELTNFKDIYRIASDTINSVNYNKSYMGISLIMQTVCYSILTDTYGDIPFSQSIKGRDSAIFEPAFDEQKKIYEGMFTMLEEANNLLKSNTAIVQNSDPVYNGNVQLWRKFGNSLYLRLLLRLSGKAEVSSLVQAKMKEIVQTNAANYPIMATVDESAVLRWTGIGPYVSPFNSIREQDWRQPGMASFFIDNLVIWGDPRLDITQWTGGANRWGITTYLGAYAGVPSGYQPGTGVIRKSTMLSNTSAVSLQKDPMTGILMTHAELQFILAEAAMKGYINTTTTAEQYYKNGALSSIKYWMPAWNVPIDTYLTNADINWNNNYSEFQKMELIHKQKYYALFMTDMQQWFEYRRTGHPVLPMGAGLLNGGVMPARMVYPVYVQSTNPTNYRIAVNRQGPDVQSTQVWWQKP